MERHGWAAEETDCLDLTQETNMVFARMEKSARYALRVVLKRDCVKLEFERVVDCRPPCSASSVFFFLL